MGKGKNGYEEQRETKMGKGKDTSTKQERQRQNKIKTKRQNREKDKTRQSERQNHYKAEEVVRAEDGGGGNYEPRESGEGWRGHR